MFFTFPSTYGILTIMNNVLTKRKTDLANEVKSLITNMTGRTVNSSPGEGFEFMENQNFLNDKRSIDNSIKEFNILFNVLCHNGWEVNSKVDEFDTSIHLTKDHCFVSLSVGRNGLYVYFEEI